MVDDMERAPGVQRQTDRFNAFGPHVHLTALAFLP